MAISPIISIDTPPGNNVDVFSLGPFRRGSLLNRIVFYFAPQATTGSATLTYAVRLFDNVPNATTFDDGIRVAENFSIPILGSFISFDIPLYVPIYDKRYVGIRIISDVTTYTVTVGTAVNVLPPQNEKRIT